MKLEIQSRALTPNSALLDHVEQSIAANVRLQSNLLVRLRVWLIAEHEWIRCRFEVGVRSGAFRVIEVMSSDVMLAVDVASERLGDVLERCARDERRAA